MRERTHAERVASRDGYFTPESVIRRVGSTPVTPFLGGGTAVLLQVAHPLVAADVARIFGTPAAVVPRTLADFRDYFRKQIEGKTIEVTPTAREIADVVLKAPFPLPMQVFGPAHRVATAAQLPPRLRREYGLGWTPVHGLALNVLAQPVKLAAWPMLLATARWRPPAAVASY